MVYCGKPSKGCLACRSRKTRCDRATPSCSQCIRAKRECPGYRNQLDLMFRNESQAVIGKVTTQKSRKQKVSSTVARSSPKLQAARVKIPTSAEQAYESFLPSLNQNYVPESISPTIEDRALGFYKNKGAIWLRNFDLVETICNQSNTDEYLRASLGAVGLASYAGLVRSPQLMNRARKDYGRALQLTNEALRSPIEYTKDSTLFAVISLGVFEAVAGNGAESLAAWAKHLAGASELVKLRGPAQFRTEAGQRMFVQICSNLMVEAVQYRKPMPSHILALRAGARPYVNTQDPAWRISENLLRFIEVRNTSIYTDTHPREIIKQALEVDGEFIDIVENMPANWNPKRYYSDAHPDAIWNGFFDVYDDFWILQMYNTLRIFRIQIQQLIREQIDSLGPDFAPIFSDDESSALLRSSLGIMQEMQKEILATIPQYAPYGIASFPSTLPLEPSNAYHVFWPMFLAGTMDIATPDIQQWIHNRFRTIAKEGGIQHADVLANSMIQRQTEAIWEGTENGEYSVPLKLSPFEWKLDGWAIAHGVILSAQVNKPTVMRSSPKMLQLDLNGIPAGWTGPPPPGWVPPPGFKMPSSNGTPDPQSSQGPPAGYTGGIPAGWVGPPPPGWVPPPGFKMPPQTTPNASQEKQANVKPHTEPARFSSPIPAGWTGPPPPGWVPPPGFKMPPQNGTHGQPTNPAPQTAPSRVSGQPPAGWVGPPPPGWVPPAGFKIPPSNGSSSSGLDAAKRVSVDAQVAANRSAAGIPAGWVGSPPPSWVPPPGFKMPPLNASTSSNVTRDVSVVTQVAANRSAAGIPAGWVGPPPAGWVPPPGFKMPPSNGSSSLDTMRNVAANTQVAANRSATGIPAGWVGSPPPSWVPPPGFKMPPLNASTSSNVTRDVSVVTQVAANRSAAGIPAGWVGPPPPGWTPPPGFQGPPSDYAEQSPPDWNDQRTPLSTHPSGNPQIASNEKETSTPKRHQAHSNAPPSGWDDRLSPPPSSDSAASSSKSSPVEEKPPSNLSRGPPAGWVGPPPSNWQGQMPPAAGGQFSQIQMQMPESSQKPPKGWKGPPPPGWNGQMPLTSTSSRLPKTQNGPPDSSSNTIPQGWTGPPPAGWNGQMPPSSSANHPLNTQKEPPANSSNTIPQGWTGPPPPGWNGQMPPNSSSASGSRPQTTNNTPPMDQSNSIPQGWTGPPLLGWNNGNSSSSSSNIPPPLKNTIPEALRAFIPQGWTGPPPPGWQPPAGFSMPPNFATSGPPALNPPPPVTQNTIPEELRAFIPQGWKGPPPPGWQPPPGFSMPPGSSAPGPPHSSTTTKEHERRRSKSSISKHGN